MKNFRKDGPTNILFTENSSGLLLWSVLSQFFKRGKVLNKKNNGRNFFNF